MHINQQHRVTIVASVQSNKRNLVLQLEFLLNINAISVMVGFYLGTKAPEVVSLANRP